MLIHTLEKSPLYFRFLDFIIFYLFYGSSKKPVYKNLNFIYKKFNMVFFVFRLYVNVYDKNLNAYTV